MTRVDYPYEDSESKVNFLKIEKAKNLAEPILTKLVKKLLLDKKYRTMMQGDIEVEGEEKSEEILNLLESDKVDNLKLTALASTPENPIPDYYEFDFEIGKTKYKIKGNLAEEVCKKMLD